VEEPRDARKIVFTSNKETRENIFQVFIMDVDGTHVTRLTHDSTNYFCPRFSPDGSHILFSSLTLTDDEIYLMDINGENINNLSHSPGYDRLPQFSPEGSLIVFQTYMMSADGSHRIELAHHDGDNFAPFFYPDRSQILFRSHRDGVFDLYRMGLQAGAPQLRVTNDTGHTLFGDFSSDGSTIVYFSSIDERRYTYYHIYIADADGSHRVKLTEGDWADYFPDFRPVRGR
jgi:TolB protein